MLHSGLMVFGGLRDGGQETWTLALFSVPSMYDLDRSPLKPFLKKKNHKTNTQAYYEAQIR